MPTNSHVHVVLLDFGGVIAEEGFREGLKTIARQAGLAPDSFYQQASDAVYDSGYVVGRASEHDYWDLVRQRTGIERPDEELRAQILSHFVLRPWMLDVVRGLRARGYRVSILSDQTDWLDALDRRDGFSHEFDQVYNSFHVGKAKNDPTLFADMAGRLEEPPGKILFVDDSPGHIERAQGQGFRTILYQDREAFLKEIKELGLLS